jgi:hypothetical protein
MSKVDQRGLAIARRLIALGAGVRAYSLFTDAAFLLQPHVFRSRYFDWLPESGLLVWALAAVWATCVVAVLLDRYARPALAMLAAICIYMLALDQQMYSNHLYLFVLISSLLALAGGKSVIPIFLLRCQLSIVYIFSVIAKANPTYLSGVTIAANTYIQSGHFVLLMTWLALPAELLLGVLFWLPDKRKAAAIAGVAFHIICVATVRPHLQLLVFALEMLALYTVFLWGTKEET